MIKQAIFFLLVVSFSALVSQAQVSSKRKAPNEVIPVIVGNVKYSAPTDQMGFVVARDAATDTVIWKRLVYSISYNKDLESDVQDIFIDTLYVKGRNLIIHTERGEVYSIRIKQ